MKRVLYQAVMFFMLLLLSFSPTTGYAQVDEETKNELQQVADRVAGKLMNCCSSFGGRNLQAEVDFQEVKMSKILGEITMPILVSWRGSWTGASYWIRGKLTITKGGSMEWTKQNDSGGFSPGCSGGCIR